MGTSCKDLLTCLSQGQVARENPNDADLSECGEILSSQEEEEIRIFSVLREASDAYKGEQELMLRKG